MTSVVGAVVGVDAEWIAGAAQDQRRVVVRARHSASSVTWTDAPGFDGRRDAGVEGPAEDGVGDVDGRPADRVVDRRLDPIAPFASDLARRIDGERRVGGQRRVRGRDRGVQDRRPAVVRRHAEPHPGDQRRRSADAGRLGVRRDGEMPAERRAARRRCSRRRPGVTRTVTCRTSSRTSCLASPTPSPAAGGKGGRRRCGHRHDVRRQAALLLRVRDADEALHRQPRVDRRPRAAGAATPRPRAHGRCTARPAGRHRAGATPRPASSRWALLRRSSRAPA